MCRHVADTHPRHLYAYSYKKFFKLKDIGASVQGVKNKMAMAGLDASLLDTPDAILPMPEDDEGNGTHAHSTPHIPHIRAHDGGSCRPVLLHKAEEEEAGPAESGGGGDDDGDDADDDNASDTTESSSDGEVDVEAPETQSNAPGWIHELCFPECHSVLRVVGCLCSLTRVR